MQKIVSHNPNLTLTFIHKIAFLGENFFKIDAISGKRLHRLQGKK